MKVRNTGKTRIRVEGYGYVDPGNDLTVPDDVGRSLCTKGSPFKEVKSVTGTRSGKGENNKKGQTRRSAPTETENETETESVDTAEHDKGGK